MPTDKEADMSPNSTAAERLKAARTSGKGSRRPPEYLTPEEFNRLLAAIPSRSTTGKRNRALVVVMGRAGLRLSEVIGREPFTDSDGKLHPAIPGLHPRDVDLKAGSVFVQRGKGGESRLVGIDQQAGSIIQAWIEARAALGLNGRQPLFCTIRGDDAGGRLQQSQVRTMLKRYGDKAGIEKRVHPHGLRHMMASQLAAEGVPLSETQAQLGHASAATTDRYLRKIAPTELLQRMRDRRWDGAPVAAEAEPVTLTPEQRIAELEAQLATILKQQQG